MWKLLSLLSLRHSPAPEECFGCFEELKDHAHVSLKTQNHMKCQNVASITISLKMPTVMVLLYSKQFTPVYMLISENTYITSGEGRKDSNL